MKRLLIIGAGGFGREVLSWAMDIPKKNRDWQIGGFLDINPNALKELDYDYPIIDPLLYTLNAEDRFICGIGRPETKLNICRKMIRNGGQFINIIHPSVRIGKNVTIGNGCIICPGSIITSDVIIGDFVTINLQSTIGHNAIISDGCTLSCHVDITGYVRLGTAVFLGSHASVLPGAVVGDYSTVGAGSVVLKKVNPCATVMGVPAKQITGF